MSSFHLASPAPERARDGDLCAVTRRDFGDFGQVFVAEFVLADDDFAAQIVLAAKKASRLAAPRLLSGMRAKAASEVVIFVHNCLRQRACGPGSRKALLLASAFSDDYDLAVGCTFALPDGS
jgi:hypothetical protein